MILTVRHMTRYSYERPLRQMVQSLRLFPSLCESQTLLDWRVTVSSGAAKTAIPAADPAQAAGMQQQAAGGSLMQSLGGMSQSLGRSQPDGAAPEMRQMAGASERTVSQPVTVAEGGKVGAVFRDGCGDRHETVSLRGPLSEITILVEGQVETQDTSGILRGFRETAAPGLYLRPTWATQPDSALSELAQEVAARMQGKTRLALAHELSSEISQRIAYVPGETGAGTTAAEALGRGRGVCQDHAHALISVAQQLGIPARYVVGYLATEGAIGEASHAWAELWLDGFGWIGFDPANRCCPDPRYIRLCSGYDARDAAPIRGVGNGSGAEALEVEVAVRVSQI